MPAASALRFQRSGSSQLPGDVRRRGSRASKRAQRRRCDMAAA